MTHFSERRRGPWMGKLVSAIFLLVLGGLATQFLNIPVQQMHQDDRLNAIDEHLKAMDKHLEYNDQRLDQFNRQHMDMERKLDDLKKLHGEGRRK